MRILVIDDDKNIQDLICSMLRGEDYEVFTAADGIEGMKIIKNDPQIEIVILDLIMPEKEGMEIIREIRKDFAHLKILAISGGGKINAKNYLILAKGIGADKTLEKPFLKKELLDSLNSIK